jgi:uncharacterized protein
MMYKMVRGRDNPLTPETCRAGRALVGMTQIQLARQAGVSRLTVANFESSARKPIPATLGAIRSTLEAARVMFVPGGAVLRDRVPSSANHQELSAVLGTLRNAAASLRQLGVKHLSLFGSAARGTQQADSDIDLLIDLDDNRRLDLLDYAGIVAQIQKLVARDVDVARRDKLKSHVARQALRDEIHVF